VIVEHHVSKFLHNYRKLQFHSSMFLHVYTECKFVVNNDVAILVFIVGLVKSTFYTCCSSISYTVCVRVPTTRLHV